MTLMQKKRVKSKYGKGSVKKSGRKNVLRHLPLTLFTLVVLYAIIYSIKFVGGPSFYGDDTTYLNLAHDVITGVFHQNNYIFSVRLLQIFPIAFFYKFFGVSMLTSSAWDIASFVLSIVVAFYLGKELYNEYAGFVSALLLSFFPLVVILAPTISDDITMMFLTSFAMLALIKGQKKNSKLWFFVAGALLVASPLVTPEGVIIIFFAIFYLSIELLRRKISVNEVSLHLIYGILVAGLLLMLFNYLNAKDPLVTYHVNSYFYSAVCAKSSSGTCSTIPSTNEDLNFYIKTMFPYSVLDLLNPFNLWKQINIVNYNQVGLYFYALLLSIFYMLYTAIKDNNHRAYFPLLWLVFTFSYLEFGPMHVSLSPFQYLLLYRLQRFLTILAVPTVILIGMALVDLAEKNKKYYYISIPLIVLALGFLAYTSTTVNLFWYKILYVQRYDQLAIANYLGSLPNNTRIYYSSAFSNLPIYMRFNNLNRFYVYDQTNNCHMMSNSSYVVIPKYINLLGLNYTPYPRSQCPSWRLIIDSEPFDNYSQSITSVGVPFRATLYYISTNSS